MEQYNKSLGRVVFSLLLFVFSVAVSAQNGRALLDKASANLRKGGVEVKFEATTYNGLSPKGSSQGVLKYSGNKYFISTSEADVWFDGTSQWTMLKNSNEVNLDNPTASEIQQTNPMAFLNLYKQKSQYMVKDVTYAGSSAKEVTVLPHTKKAFRQLVVIVSDNAVRNIRLLDAKGNWMRFKILHLKSGQNFSADTFQFNSSKFPDVEVIDLR